MYPFAVGRPYHVVFFEYTVPIPIFGSKFQRIAGNRVTHVGHPQGIAHAIGIGAMGGHQMDRYKGCKADRGMRGGGGGGGGGL